MDPLEALLNDEELENELRELEEIEASELVKPNVKPNKKYVTNKQTRIVRPGWVFKKGAQALSGWKKRYLILHSDKQLRYYTDQKLTQNKGTISLWGLTIHDIKRSTKTNDPNHFGYVLCISRKSQHHTHFKMFCYTDFA